MLSQPPHRALPLPCTMVQMIVEPELRVADFAKAGSDIISVHAEQSSTIHLHRAINQARSLRETGDHDRLSDASCCEGFSSVWGCGQPCQAGLAPPTCPASPQVPLTTLCGAQIKELGCKAGVVLNPGTSLDTIEYVLDIVDLVLVMSVNPGFGGQKFIASQVGCCCRASGGGGLVGRKTARARGGLGLRAGEEWFEACVGGWGSQFRQHSPPWSSSGPGGSVQTRATHAVRPHSTASSDCYPSARAPLTTQVRKIKALKAMCDERGVNPWIEVDGGIVPDNAWEVIEVGANALVSGSGVFKAPDYAKGESRGLFRRGVACVAAWGRCVLCAGLGGLPRSASGAGCVWRVLGTRSI